MSHFDVVDQPFADAIVALGRRRDDVVVLTADLAKWTDVGPFAEAFPDRFFQVGMAEQNLIGMAGGMAKAGLLPFAVTYGVFATRRAFDQIAMALCTGPSDAVVVGFLPGITTRFPATHQALDDVALMRVIPGMTVLDPADATELTAAVAAAADYGGPVYLRARRSSVEQCFDPRELAFTIGPARELADGPDIGVVTSGYACVWVLEALRTAPLSDLDVGVLHVPTIKPLDEDTVATFCRRYDRVTVVENHTTIGGLGEAIASALARRGQPTRIRMHGVPDRWGAYGTVEYIRRQFAFDPEGLARTLADHARTGGGADR